MYKLNAEITESRLKIVKSLKETDDSLDIIEVITNHKDQIDALGALVQHQINLMHTSYHSIGCPFEDFYDDLVMWITDRGFTYKRIPTKTYDFRDNIVVYNVICGLDYEFPYSEIGIDLQLIESIKSQ